MKRALVSSLLLLSPALVTACAGGEARSLEMLAPSLSAGDAGVDRVLAQAQCGACHALPAGANGHAARSMAPDLQELGARMSRSQLAAFLSDPAGVRPRTRMPDVLGGLPEDERGAALEGLQAFLLGADAHDRAHEDLGDALDLRTVEAGRQLYHSVGCFACHGAFETPEGLDFSLAEFDDPLEVPAHASALREFAPEDVWEEGPPLDRLGVLYDVPGLTRFLLDPLDVRPYGSMPNLDLREEEAQALASYLLFEDAVREGTITKSLVAGLAYQYFEGDFMEEGPPAFDRLQPVREGNLTDLATLPEHRGDKFGFRYTGMIEVPSDGEWTFLTASDDGSWLWVDGEPVVANGGTHPVREAEGRIQLMAGKHEIEVRFFESGGGEALDVRWEGPGVARETIPASALASLGLRIGGSTAIRDQDNSIPADYERLRGEGQRWFQKLGCIDCHELEGVDAVRPAPPLAALRAGIEQGHGCLSEHPDSGLPRYPTALTRAGGTLRAAALAATDGALALPDEARLHSTLATLRCTACHAREGVGAPAEESRKHFRIAADVDLGDEGRVPPQLDLAGWKLRDEWLTRVLSDGTKVRPYMLTRMPRFGMENVGHLAELLPALDRPRVEAGAPEFSKEAVEAATLLMGIDGLGCVQCHNLAGYEGLGVPAVDLASSHERLRWPWFRALLANPGELNMNTRMPSFWTEDGRSPVGELYGGDPVRQVEAMWSALSLSDAIPLPRGLVIPEGAYELTPLLEPIAVGVFWKGASARTTLVGFPERMHVAFDVENSRLDAAWRGRFFDARGTWHARAGALEVPPTNDSLRFPAGPPFATLARTDSPWPDELGRAAGWRARGREYDAGRRPTFVFANEALGGLVVRERPAPELRTDGVWLVRAFELRATTPDRSLWMRAGVADAIERVEDGLFVASDGWRTRVIGTAGLTRDTEGGVELLVAVPWGDEPRVEFTVETTWTKPMEATR